jgi:hypothetical protein
MGAPSASSAASARVLGGLATGQPVLRRAVTLIESAAQQVPGRLASAERQAGDALARAETAGITDGGLPEPPVLDPVRPGAARDGPGRLAGRARRGGTSSKSISGSTETNSSVS